MRNELKPGLTLRQPVSLGLLLSPGISLWRTLALYLMAWWNGGRFRPCGRLRIKGAVIFQGSGELITGANVTLGYRLAGAPASPIVLQPRERSAKIEIGESTSIMNGCELIARSLIRIGRNCQIGPWTLIYDSDFHGVAPDQRGEPGITREVILEDNVWVGSRCLILKGVTVGRDAVLGAGSVVTRDIPPGAIVAGNPALPLGSVYKEAGS